MVDSLIKFQTTFLCGYYSIVILLVSILIIFYVVIIHVSPTLPLSSLQGLPSIAFLHLPNRHTFHLVQSALMQWLVQQLHTWISEAQALAQENQHWKEMSATDQPNPCHLVAQVPRQPVLD